MSSPFTDREKACFMAGVDWRGWRPISGDAIHQSMLTAGLNPEPRETVTIRELVSRLRQKPPSGSWEDAVRAIWDEAKDKELVD